MKNIKHGTTLRQHLHKIENHTLLFLNIETRNMSVAKNLGYTDSVNFLENVEPFLDMKITWVGTKGDEVWIGVLAE